MAYIRDINKIFSDVELSWPWILRSATDIEWSDWVNRGPPCEELIVSINTKIQHIIDISDQNKIDLVTLLKQAIANSERETLPLARVAVHKLYYDGVISGSLQDWDHVFPNPTAFELYFIDYLKGIFSPSVAVFVEILLWGINSKSESNCIKNIIYASNKQTLSSVEFINLFFSLPIKDRLTPAILFNAIEGLIKDIKFLPDLDSKAINSLPVSWRIELLGRDKIANILIQTDVLARINNNPHLFQYTPEWSDDENLFLDFSKDLANGSLSERMFKQILSNQFLRDRLINRIDWSFVSSLEKPILIKDFKLSAFKKIISQLDKGNYEKFANNLVTIISPSLSDLDLLDDNYKNKLKFLIQNSDSSVKFAAISIAASNTQYTIIQLAIGDGRDLLTRELCVNAFFKKPSEDLILPITMLTLLPFMGNLPKKWSYEIADRHQRIGSYILQFDQEYQAHFWEILSAKRIDKYVISDDYLKAYGSLGNKGVEIIEFILSNNTKVVGSPSISNLLSQVAKHCVQIASTIFRKRGINSKNFVQLVSSCSFAGLTNDKQIEIFSLKNKKGRSVLKQVLNSNLLPKNTIDWLNSQGHLRQALIINAPILAPSQNDNLSDLLVSCCARPSKAQDILSNHTKEALIQALPAALHALRHKPRIAGALELAVQSELSALPIMMRLAYRLSPPYDKDSYGHRYNNLYTTYELPKKSGGKRIISAPAPHLKSVQRSLLNLLYSEQFSDQAMGFIPGRSIKDNAQIHVGQKIVVNADIKAFFPSTTYKQVYSLSRRLCGGSLSPFAARLFSEICCFNGNLATGSPTSPAISNLIMLNFDHFISNISKKLDVNYTRYADDITFSGDSASVWMLKPLKTYLTRLGYELDPKKTNIFRKGRRQTVTGLVVNKQPNIARPLRKRLRAAVYRRINGEIPFLHDKKLSDAALYGYINYLRMISPDKASQLLNKLRGCPKWKY